MGDQLSTLLGLLAIIFAVIATSLIILQLVFLVRFKQLQRRYSRAILATNSGVWEWFPGNNRLYISSDFFLRLGFREKQVPTRLSEWLELLSVEEKDIFERWQDELLQQKKGVVKPVRLSIENQDKEKYWIEIRGSVTRVDRLNKVQSVAGVIEEVSHLVAAENALLEAKEEARRRELLLTSLINNIPDIIWSKDEHGKYLDCNQAFLEFNSLTSQEVKGKSDQELNLDGKGDYYQEQDNQVLKTGITFHEQNWGHSQGDESRLFDIHRVPVIEPSIHFRGVLGIARDITEHHHLLKQLKSFKSFADNSAQGFAMASFYDGNITYFNKKMCDLLGVNDDVDDKSLKQFHFLEFYPETTQKFLQNTVIPYVKEHGVWEGELEARSLDGRVFATYETYFVLHDENGRATSVGDIMNDITEQKNVSQQLEQAKEAAEQANQAKSHFLANMSHEIRTPLNAIIGYAQLIEEDDTLSGVSRSRFTAIASAGERLLGLINDILDIARIESGRLILHEQKVNICKEVKQIGKLFSGQAQEKGLSLFVECHLEDGPLVWVDPVKFQQVLTNLIGNAIKFTQQGHVKVVAWGEDQQILIEIEDTGPGIEDDLVDHLFTPFVQGKAGDASGGTGLGMALSLTLVKLMKGTLSVDSTPEVGTKIRIALPLVEVPQEALSEENDIDILLNMRLNNPITVLVAEDDSWSRDILVSILEKAGCQIIEANDGEQAIKAFQANRPDFVMTDIRMPIKTGIDFLKFIQEADPSRSIPVVAVTASTLIHEQQALIDDGFWQVIAKPYRAEEIYKALVTHANVEFVSLFDKSIKGQIDESLDVAIEKENIELLNLAVEEWQPLLLAAQNGDIEQAEEAFLLIQQKLPAFHQKKLQHAIAQFDLGLVEDLIIEYQSMA
ncbi:ATP-binding protein [Marinomonas sp. 2405UD66-6]|uniref:hybrid sensor histidine kinase/response regulator n=1 Tax=Marinomonas sp. 2405UD66-6 TaxID=3391834 RepID=UPI0039C9EC3E